MPRANLAKRHPAIKRKRHQQLLACPVCSSGHGAVANSVTLSGACSVQQTVHEQPSSKSRHSSSTFIDRTSYGNGWIPFQPAEPQQTTVSSLHHWYLPLDSRCQVGCILGLDRGWRPVPPDQFPGNRSHLHINRDGNDVFPAQQLSDYPFGRVVIMAFKVSYFNRCFYRNRDFQLAAFGSSNDVSARFGKICFSSEIADDYAGVP